MRIVLFGAPGVGKGTQAALLNERRGLKHISTGDLLRQAIRNETPIGMEVKRFIERGQLAPSSLVLDLLIPALQVLDYDSFNLDGFPRTVDQAEWLTDHLAEHDAPLNAVISLRVPIDIVVDRLSKRRIHKLTGESYHLDTRPPPPDVDPDLIIQRADDHPNAVRKRMQVYRLETLPVINYYRGTGIYYEVDGLGDFEEVYSRIDAVLEHALRAGSFA
ncbi:MAG TPA: adenylate kinase [Rhodothermales bacterium]|nr:adenylate kinase [Rhodothermales bacterium]